MAAASPSPGQRIDKWLWFARIIKSRTLAAKFVTSGKIRLNATRITKPSYVVQVGDTLTFMRNDRLRVVEIADTGTRRGPASEAQALYLDHSPPLPEKNSTSGAHGKVAPRDPGAGRPTKKQRRDMEKLMGEF